MAGGGSIQNMLNTLKNNKNLLPKRKSFFKRDLNYFELRKYYQESPLYFSNKKITKEELLLIRNKIREDRKRSKILVFTTFLSVFVVFSVVLVLLVQNLDFSVKKFVRNSHSGIPSKSFKNQDLYSDRMSDGINRLNEGKWFLAIGNFQAALADKPNDKEAEYLLSKSYVFYCFEENNSCDKANTLLNEMLIKYPQDTRFQILSDFL